MRRPTSWRPPFPGRRGAGRRPRRAAPADVRVGAPGARRGGRSLRYLVPDAVAAYIGDHALYRTPQHRERTNHGGPIERDRFRRPTPTPSRLPNAAGLPRRDGPARRPSDRVALDLARRIVELAEDKKAADIVLLDLTPLTTLADYFVICSGGSERQLDAIADGIIVVRCATSRPSPSGGKGHPRRTGSCSTSASVIVHIFTPPERDYYGLEKHWGEAKTILRVQ